MTEPSAKPVPWAVIVNPTKFDDLEAVQEQVGLHCATHDWPEPLWYSTLAEDPGVGQTTQALAEGAELVCPLGGDGTVRAVASALVGTGTPLGLLPGGTGNLLARNLKLPIDDLDAALTIALTGRDMPIDAGEVTWDDDAPAIFLVMAGMGLDGDMMAEVDPGLKRKVGWLAYAVSGARALFRLGFAVKVVAGGDKVVSQHARTLLVANCGELAAGLQLIPQAEVDDGLLDTVLASPNSLMAWLALVLHFVSVKRRGHPPLVKWVSTRIRATTREPVQAQLDGDAVGRRRHMECRVLPGALTVRVPA